MSKASEYMDAKRKFADKALVRPEFREHIGDATFIACVDGGGGLHISVPYMSPVTAVRFARWIIDTFGEAE